MFSLLHLLFSLIHLALGIVATRWYLRTRSSYTLLTLPVLYGLFYDNLVIALGASLGEGALLQTLNVGRFIIHALFTPFLVICAFGIARHVGLNWAQGRTLHTTFCVLAALLIALGVYSDIVRFQPKAELFFDALRYTNSGGIPGPPIPAIATIIVLIIVGLLVWRKTRWLWLLLGSLVMFVAAAASPRAVSVGNLGEVVMMGTVVATTSRWLRADLT